MEMANPHHSMVSFQQELRAGRLELNVVRNYHDVYSHFDEPAQGVFRLTYVRLSKDRMTVKAFVACVMNGQVDGFPCTSVGYAVPEDMRNQGFAKQLLREAIQDQAFQAGQVGHKAIYVEAVADVTNLPSQRVAEAVLAVEREPITDSASGRPAYRYTLRLPT